MSYYIRKINRAKWKIAENLQEQEDINKLNADYLSTCLKTSQGQISLWKIEDVSQINDVVAAICSTGEHVNKVDFILLEENELSAIDILPINEPEGNSKIRENHYTIANLNYEKIGMLAKLIFNILENNENRYKRIQEPIVKKILIDAIENKEIKLPLHPTLMEELNINVG